MKSMSITPEMVYNLRVSANLSRDSAAIITCVTRRTWDSWETGQRNMPESAFRFFISQVTGERFNLETEEPIKHTKLLVFFDYKYGIRPLDCVSPEVFMAVEPTGEDEAIVTSMTTNPDGTRSPRKTTFKISDNLKNFNTLLTW